MTLRSSIIVSALTWPLMMAIGLPLYIIGLVLVPLAVLLKAYYEVDSTYYFKKVLLFKWRIMAPYNNLEDGCCPPEYRDRHPKLPLGILIIMWTQFRNPISGLRWTPYLSLRIKASEVQYTGSLGQLPLDRLPEYEAKKPVWYYAWQGPYACIWYQFMLGSELWRLWVGHKLYPDDVNGGPYGYRQHGAGFAMQFKRVQKGDNKN